jgi:ankyrin repeat protein
MATRKMMSSKMMRSVFEKDVENLVRLLEEEENVNYFNGGTGETLLFWSAKEGYTDLVRLLLDRGADIEQSEFHVSGSTPLIKAAFEGHIEVVKLLIERGANVNHVNDSGWTAIKYAIAQNHKEVVEVLSLAGANKPPSIEEALKMRKQMK